MSNELELKFLMSPSHLAQLVTTLPQLAQIQSSDTTTLLNAYFDTAEHWFRGHDMGLRSRLKRGSYEQTIKLSGAQHGAMQMRPEYNVACSTVLPQLLNFPAHIWPQKTDISVLQAQLIELFRTDFNRQSWLLKCTDGTVIELAYDQGQVIANQQQQAIAELELELISGNAEQLFILARQLLQLIPLRTGWQSKAARGYRLAATQDVALPLVGANTLLAQISTLQQAEACYMQQGGRVALTMSANALFALANLMQNIPVLQSFSVSAIRLAQALPNNAELFAGQEYNLLLLTLSEYLFKNA
ncbi:CYTH domain-containing protein [Rheinheimera metallidurans]|uniref:CYTH domain-containing protein n=1 Tax=Rheinheimera metallidurans TaxID=2925781 RepID=UPI0030010FFC